MITRILGVMLMFVGLGFAQMPLPPMGHMEPGHGPEFHVFEGGHHLGGPQWWKNPEIAQEIGINDEQVQKLNQMSLDHRIKMIDLRAALAREEVKLQPLMQAPTPDENQILAQIDKISNQRAQIEKAQVQMMLATRRALTPEQWKKLQGTFHSHFAPMRHDDERGHGANRMWRQGFKGGPGQGQEPNAAAPSPRM